MATKTIKSRIQNKCATYTEWMTADPVLLKGEIAIVEIPAETGAVAKEPIRLMKSGDGTKKFSQLEFIGGYAADVYDWAKASTKPTYTATEITGLNDLITETVKDTDTQYKLVQDDNNPRKLTLSSKGLNETTWTIQNSIILPETEVPEYTIQKKSTADDGYIASYQLMKDSTAVGDTINIPKDYLVKSVTLNTCTEKDKPLTGLVKGDKYIDWVVNTKDGSGNESHLYLNVNDLVDVYTAGNGIEISDKNVVSVKLATENSSGAISSTDYKKISELDTLLAEKADKQSSDGGFVAGEGAIVDDSGSAPIAIGNTAKAAGPGVAIGRNATVDSGSGVSIGMSTKSAEGVAIGYGAKIQDPGTSTDGIVNRTNAVQLGEGTNANEYTMQVYDYQLLADDATTKSATDGGKYLKDVGNLDKLYTSVKKGNIVNAINEIVGNKSNIKNTNGGFSAGEQAATINGGSIGNMSKSEAGGSIGTGANTTDGGAVGASSESTTGGAVGSSAKTSSGFAGGYNAQTIANEKTIDAIQLGTGTNANEFTMKIYDYQLLADDAGTETGGGVETKSATDGCKYLKDVGKLSDLTTTNKENIVSAINYLLSNIIGDTSTMKDFLDTDKLVDAILTLDSDKVDSEELKTIATTGNINDLLQTDGDYIIINCGDASTVI